MPVLLLLLLLSAPHLQAQQPAAYDCEKNSAHRQFDFWLGNWRVSDAAGEKYYGNNSIRSEQKGCLLSENWASAGGGSGASMNYYHPADGKWHQQWNDAGASIITISGGLRNGSMVMDGEIYYLVAQRSAAFRGSWTLLEDGRVRQFFEEKDQHGNWQAWFDGYYTREE